MKVVIVSFSFSQGGAAIAADKFAGIIDGLHRVEGIRIRAESDVDNKKGVAYTIHLLKRIISHFLLVFMSDGNPIKHSLNIFSSRKLLKYLRSEGYNCETVFNFHWFNNDLLSVFRLSSIPKFSVITLHDEWLYCGSEHYANVLISDDYFFRGYKYFQKNVKGFNWNFVIWRLKIFHLSRRNDLVITVPSSWMLERAKSSVLLRDKEIRLLPNPIPTDIFFPASNKEKKHLREHFGLTGKDILICLGGVNEKSNILKGYDLVEQALILFKEKASAEFLNKICLVFFGYGVYGKDLFHGFRMINLGKISSAVKMRDMYAMCDWTLVPSKVESFGQVAAESLACETPVIAFNTSGLKDVVIDRENGFLVEPFNSEDYASCIVNALKIDSIGYNIMKKAGRRHIERNFATSVVKKAYLNILDTALERRRNLMNKRCL